MLSDCATRYSSFLILAIVMAIILPAFAAAQELRPTLELTETNLANTLDPVMTNWITKLHGPGAVIVVANRDGIKFAKGYGYSDVETKKPFTVDTTLVRPGSISKLFTGIAVMQLVEAGKLDLDRDINSYIDLAIPIPSGGVPVTLRRLLSHRAGFEEQVKDLFSFTPSRSRLANGSQSTSHGAFFPTAMSKLIRTMALHSQAMWSSASQESLMWLTFSATFSIRSG